MAENGFILTEKQQELNRLISGPATHILAYGGARSGKTVCFVRALFVRAIKAPGSRHLAARFRFNHCIQSLWFNTFPYVLKACFPEVEAQIVQDKQNWFWKFSNGSEIWFGGLDAGDRVEKLLGNEYSSVYLNECSQISWQARNTIVTRLAQNVGLKLKCFYDENPPLATHWSARTFVEHRSPEPPHLPLADPDNYVAIQMNPTHNRDNLPATYLEELARLPERERRRFLDGLFGSATEGALWDVDTIGRNRVADYPGDLQRVIIGVDPSGVRSTQDFASDEVGIVVCGLDRQGIGYVLEDCSCRAGPAVWGRVAVSAYERHKADAIVVERNFGGEMALQVVRTAAADAGVRVNLRETTASRGKILRAEPVSALYEQNKIRHHGSLAELEDQMLSMTTLGYMGSGSPDRVDAMVFCFADLFPGLVRPDAKKKRTEHQKEGCFSGGWDSQW